MRDLERYRQENASKNIKYIGEHRENREAQAWPPFCPAYLPPCRQAALCQAVGICIRAYIMSGNEWPITAHQEAPSP